MTHHKLEHDQNTPNRIKKNPTCVLFGATGMLGTTLSQHLERHNQTVIKLSKSIGNICDDAAIESGLSHVEPGDIVINCAAYTKVDDCEAQRELAHQVNAEGPQKLAQACQKKGLILIHFSTDYVFNGESDHPYQENDETQPINVYGDSKLAGEKAIREALDAYYILRVQWLYGPGPNFVKTISELAKTKPSLSIVSDQWGSPTSTQSVSEAVLALIQHRPQYGLYHFHDEGYTTWYDYARFFLAQLKRRIAILPVTSEAFPRPAKRPKQSRLDMSKFLALGIYTPPSWKAAVTQYVAEEVEAS